ncbi:prepilin-type N-terminal cleavage/methylation domain-containing protein [Noviherbaspirillum galbum]|uniref:Prepilin-type N-terminal cleavage/methylation domain-containing protein n=1 Tax=Noviherbaspirillum galbum TaxID=2709383 RepID=A0A6B3SUV2_9BURK|nr:prepilin-type N-terminal cleavage/methylation domain-containing protein [Noviherbaspirillum galbum]NEX64583.1 prepilin-type N-terminal cleavage/methylation domain-containing protein [Noviherbaspirillum galbum]
MLTRARQSGMTLIEVLVASAIGLFLLLGLTTFMTNNLTSNANLQKAAALNQELRAIMSLVSRDVRRAGYWASPSYASGALSGIGAGNTYSNPFSTINTATAGCILYSYDRNGNGVLDSTEKFGFLLDSGVVQMRTNVGATAFDCTTDSGNAWGELSDSKNTRITALSFTETDSSPIYLSGTAGPNIKVRRITITLTGQLKNDATVSQTLTETVRVENDLYSPT